MTAAALDPTAQQAVRAPVGPAGMDGIARLAARVAGAPTAAVVVGSGTERRVVAVVGGEHVAVLGPDAAPPAAAVPMVGPDGTYRGSVEVFGPVELDPAGHDLLTDLAAQAVALLELHRATAELARSAGRDALTGLPNRRSVEAAISSAIARAERGLGTPSVVVVDLDRFGELVATGGRAAGDAVLSAVADRLTRSARAVDTVGRIGADQFLVLLESTGGPGATAAVARLRGSLVGGWESVPGGARVSASLGITTYRPGDSVASLIARADAEMFADKARRHA